MRGDLMLSQTYAALSRLLSGQICKRIGNFVETRTQHENWEIDVKL